MINLRECYSIFLNVLSKQLINIHITHFQLPLKHSERYLRYSDVRPIYRIEAIDPKDTFLLSQYLSRTQIQHKLPKCINAFYQLWYEDFERLKFIAFAKPMEIEMTEF